MTISNPINELTSALAKAQAEINNPTRDANNPFFKSKYVKLDAIINATKGILAKYGLAVIQTPVTTEAGIGVKTLLTHASGQYIEFDPLYMNPVKDDPQGLGSVITYARRYSLAAVLNLEGEEDDDGNSASGRTQPQPQPEPKPQPKPVPKPKPQPKPEPKPEVKEEPIPTPAEQPTNNADVTPAPFLDNPADSLIICHECGQMIKPVTRRDGTTMTPAELAEYSFTKFGKILCADCAKRAAKQ